ncbi:hypothetical protein SAMN02745753_03976 [Marinomonas polaris DSM 16579]|jgi:hypothetical protein|uniref:Uncharacterized protein n=1 Tax=Marinomonas polaris DSM 16579 TaxID=1122206 RepID=A0A1M5K1P7_9GAMM|nr:hypothetical protein [Marinomonas polaris]SHG46671.1 hypothetical protein SAMN02745753_03976 [Marinomonas polaris DSM 16579]
MTNEVVNFLVEEATSEGFKTESAIFGELFLENEPRSIRQSTGAVYGVLVESKTPPRKDLKPIKGFPNLYPVYWGKDIAPVSRLKAHVQNHQSTGNADLRSIEEIQGKRLLFGAIFVEKYSEFEGYLHDSYPPIKGQKSRGRTGTIVEVIN